MRLATGRFTRHEFGRTVLAFALGFTAVIGQTYVAQPALATNTSANVIAAGGSEQVFNQNTAFRSSASIPTAVDLMLGEPNAAPQLSVVSTYDTGLGENGAEIIDIRGDYAVLTNAGNSSIDILNTADLLTITRTQRIGVAAGLNSAAIHPSKDFFLTVSGTAGNVGTVAAYRLSTGTFIVSATTGIQPDSVDIAPNGQYAVIANEAEASGQGNNGGDGSLTVVDLRTFEPVTSTTLSVSQVALPSQAGTTGFSTGRTDDAGRLPVDNTPGTLEPESVTFSPNSEFAYVTLQENNGVVRIALANNGLAFFGLGDTTHAADITSGDGYNPSGTLTLPREPDGIAVSPDGSLFVTADEGDTRNGAAAGAIRGGRTVSVFNAQTGALIGDTGNQLDAIAARFGIYPDARSNRGGAEPEVLDIASFGGKLIVAVGLERANAVAFIDLTTPATPQVFGVVPTGANPEGVKLVVRDGSLYAVTANEVGGTVTVARVPVGAFALNLAYSTNTALALPNLLVVDPDTTDTLTITLTLNPAQGTLSGAGVAGASNGIYTISGSRAEVNATLASLTFTPTTNRIGTATISISVTDGTNATVSGMISLSVPLRMVYLPLVNTTK